MEDNEERVGQRARREQHEPGAGIGHLGSGVGEERLAESDAGVPDRPRPAPE
ncbi:MAG: hypothetical protein M0C28_28060 [Candidatus Moduliflexus flocculans]|nr:hypothetical protein [Candidatus Moduliflexus flocculans]